MPRMKLSERGYALLEEREGYTPVAKHLAGDRPTVITGGFGDTHVAPGETHTRPEWEARLRQRVAFYESYVNTGVIAPLTQSMFDALVLLVYNIGPGNPHAQPPVAGFLTSTLRRKLNLGDYEGAADEFKVWNKVDGKECNGLVNRRAVEESLFRAGMAELAVVSFRP